MSHPLAVFTPVIGQWAHHYVRVHIERILPGRTAVVGVCALEPHPLRWSVDAPQLAVEPPIRVDEYDADPALVKSACIPEGHQARFRSAEHRARMRDFLARHGVRVVLAQWLDTALWMLPVAKEMGLRFFAQAHGTDITGAITSDALRAAYRAYEGADGVLSPSEFGRRQLVDVGLPPEKVHVVRHPVAIPSSVASPPEHPVRCVVVGRMDPMKGPLLAVEAFARARAAGADLHLDYVGDGILHDAVRQRVGALGIADRVTLHGALPHDRVREVLGRGHLFLHPSVVHGDEPRYDTCPVAVAEAMAHGLPVVATRHGGIPEEVAHGVSGLLVDEYDVAGLAEAIVALARDPALRQKMGDAGRERAHDAFSLPVVRERMLDLLGLDGPRGQSKS
jgi:glycosyltransferase involved in cell wall biosynthesis